MAERCKWFAYRLQPKTIVCAKDKKTAAKKLAPFGFIIAGGRKRKVSSNQIIKIKVKK